MNEPATSSEAVTSHRAAAPRRVRFAVLTVSDTRTLEADTSGALIAELARAGGHELIERAIVPDEPGLIRDVIERWQASGAVDAALVTGGTGISPRDQTYETISAMLTKPLAGYGELFRMLSYAEIGAAAMLSRAIGGLAGSLVVLAMPGSKAAVRLAMEKLILPEIGHIVREATKV